MEDIYDIQKRLESVRQRISRSSMIESNKTSSCYEMGIIKHYEKEGC